MQFMVWCSEELSWLVYTAIQGFKKEERCLLISVTQKKSDYYYAWHVEKIVGAQLDSE